MRLKMMMVVLSALFLLTGSAFAADVTGTWMAEMPAFGGGPGGGGGQGGGQQAPRQIIFDLKADGAKLTGMVKSSRGESEIIDGKIDGDKVSFAIKRQGFQGNEMTIKYDGTVAGDELTVKMSFEGGTGGGRAAAPVVVECRCLH